MDWGDTDIALLPQRCSQIHGFLQLGVMQTAIDFCCDPYCIFVGYSRYHQKVLAKNEMKFKRQMQCLCVYIYVQIYLCIYNEECTLKYC